MLSQTKQKIIQFLRQNPDSSLKNIIDYIEISKQAISRHLKELLTENLIDKKGSPPRVYYFALEENLKDTFLLDLGSELNSKIEENFVLFTADGKIQTGIKGFQEWCLSRKFKPGDYAQKYSDILEKYNNYKNQFGLIDATGKIAKTYGNQTSLDKLFYSEFSAYEIFGRTKLYSFLLYGKQAEDKKLIRNTVLEIKEHVLSLIIQTKIDAVGFIPPTVPRQIQFQREFERNLNLPLPVIKIEKVKNDILIPQKTLKTPAERIENSIKTIVVPENREFLNILLIDDFVGSGATLNFTAQKLRAKFPQIKNIIGYAICGTPNGVIDNSQKFEVVNEV